MNGAADVAAPGELQAQFRLTPLSLWTKTKAVAPEHHDVYAPGDPADDPLAVWMTLNAMLAENPPPADHGLLLGQFARVGVGAGLDVDAQPEVVRHGLMRAAAIGLPLLRRQFLSGDWAEVVDGWRYPPPEEGRFGDDYLRRAADQSLAGIVANDPAEAVYLVDFSDSDGRHLSGRGRYELHFDRGELPPVDAFWSLTAYTGDMNLIPNPVDRYSVGDRTPGLVHDPAGGLTIYMQPAPPGPEQEPNWLPTSPDHDWFVILRMYRPHTRVVESKWRCPGVVRVG